MSRNDEPSAIDLQGLAERKYAALKIAVEKAGFFALQMVGTCDGDHLTCTSKRLDEEKYSGRVAFVSECMGRWYLATPHPYRYCILNSSRVEQAVIAFLRDGTDRLDELALIRHEEYERALGRG